MFNNLWTHDSLCISFFNQMKFFSNVDSVEITFMFTVVVYFQFMLFHILTIVCLGNYKQS